MRSFLASLLLGVCLVAIGGGLAAAHAVALFGELAVDPTGQVQVRLVDVYGGRVEGQAVVAYATIPGGRPTKAEPLTETAPGTYEGLVRPAGAERYSVTIDLDLGGDIHRIVHEVTVGEASAEQLVQMVQIEPTGPPLGRVLFIAAGVLLLVGTVVAFLKRPGVEAS